MNAPGGGGAGGPGLLGVGLGGCGLGGPVGLVGFGLGLEVVGHSSQYQRFLQRLLQSLMVPGLHSVLGTFEHEVLYFFHSHFRTRFQQLRLFGVFAKSYVAPASIPVSAKGTSEGSKGKS